MYTFNRVIKDEKNISTRRREVLVEFIDGEKTLEKDLSFKIDATDLEVKRAFKQFLDEINFVPAPITDLTYTEPEADTPNPAEVAKAQWLDDYQKLRAATKLNELGVQVVTATQLAALQKRVKDNFLVEYTEYVS